MPSIITLPELGASTLKMMLMIVGFTGAVGAEQADNFAGADFKRNVVHRDFGGVMLA